MNTNYIYTTKQVKDAVKNAVKGHMPMVYRDVNKKHVRYKVDVKPTEEVLKRLQEQLPFAEVKPFLWRGFHPLAPHNGEFRKEVIVIRVPESVDYVAEVHKLVDAIIDVENIHWNPDETIYDLVLELSNGAQISKGVDYGELYYRASDEEGWLPLQDIYGEAPKMANPDEVLKELREFGVKTWFLD